MPYVIRSSFLILLPIGLSFLQSSVWNTALTPYQQNACMIIPEIKMSFHRKGPDRICFKKGFINIRRLSTKSKLPEKNSRGSGLQPRSFHFAAASRSHNQLNLLFSDNRLILLRLGIAATASAGEFEDFSKDGQLQDLYAAVRCFFDAVAHFGVLK